MKERLRKYPKFSAPKNKPKTKSLLTGHSAIFQMNWTKLAKWGKKNNDKKILWKTFPFWAAEICRFSRFVHCAIVRCVFILCKTEIYLLVMMMMNIIPSSDLPSLARPSVRVQPECLGGVRRGRGRPGLSLIFYILISSQPLSLPPPSVQPAKLLINCLCRKR